jgi:exopolysaccharide biosynthesis polyprenyl glycosylphosphotransferase
MATQPRQQLDEPGFFPSAYNPHLVTSSSDRLFGLGIAFLDLLLIVLSGVVVLYEYYLALPASEHTKSWFFAEPMCQRHLGVFLVFAVLTVLSINSRGLHKVIERRSALDEALSLLQAVVFAAVLLTALLYVSKATDVSRLIVGSTAMVAFVALLSWRLAKRKVVHRQMVSGYGCRNVLIVGAGEAGRRLSRFLKANPQLGYRVCGFLDDEPRTNATVLGCTSDFESVAMANFVDEVVITIPAPNDAIRQILLTAREHKLGVKLVPGWLESLGWNCRVQQLGIFPVITLQEHHIPALSLALKRLIDIVFSACALIVLAPFFLVLAIVIRLDSKGEIIYRSKRVGRRGREFECYKFRTMVRDAEQRQPELELLNERTTILFKIKNDPRLTRLGRWLRKYSIDELPQFWNVLKGDMSIVGPRPPIPSEVRRYQLEHLKRIDMTPGITGLWQITARCNPSFQKYLQCDLEYTSNWSLKLDLKIMLKTIPVVLKGTGQ